MRLTIMPFFNEVKKIEKRYHSRKNVEELSETISQLGEKYGDFPGGGDYLLNLAESSFEKGDRSAGFAIVRFEF